MVVGVVGVGVWGSPVCPSRLKPAGTSERRRAGAAACRHPNPLRKLRPENLSAGVVAHHVLAASDACLGTGLSCGTSSGTCGAL